MQMNSGEQVNAQMPAADNGDVYLRLSELRRGAGREQVRLTPVVPGIARVLWRHQCPPPVPGLVRDVHLTAGLRRGRGEVLRFTARSLKSCPRGDSVLRGGQ